MSWEDIVKAEIKDIINDIHFFCADYDKLLEEYSFDPEVFKILKRMEENIDDLEDYVRRLSAHRNLDEEELQ
tara:strand:- start:87 stop:302 length:216 start_codon:yes stop_codon:yes gene_type:complete